MTSKEDGERDGGNGPVKIPNKVVQDIWREASKYITYKTSSNATN